MRLRGLVAAGAMALGAVALSPSVAGAHANLTLSSPADGESLAASPAELVLTFTEQPEPSLSSIRVLNASGATLVDDPPRPAQEDDLALTVPLPTLEHGVYTVSWRVVSRVDGHATAGAFAFGIGEQPTALAEHPVAESEQGPPPPMELAGRWLLLAGLVALVGGAAIAAVVLRSSPRAPLGFLLGAWAVTVAGVVLLGWAQVQAGGAGLGSLMATPIGRGLILRAVGIAVAGTGLGAAALDPSSRRRVWFGLAAVAGAGALLAHVAAGHAAASRPALAQVTAQWVHVTAAAVWIGGLAALLLAIRGEPDDARGRAVRRFSTVAGVALAAVVGTGLVRALNQVRSLDNLFSTAYGRVVILKVALLAILATLGAVNRYRNVPRSHRTLSGLRRVSGAELSVAVAILGATALLASIAPPTAEPARASGEMDRLVARGSDFGTSVRVTLQVSPGHAGPNRFDVHATDYDTDQPVQAQRVALRFSYLSGHDVGESTLELRPAGDGDYTATAGSLSIDGRWQVTVLVQQAIDAVEIPLLIGTHCVTTPLVTEGAPTINTIAPHTGGTVQGYVDPGVAGVNQVHFTFFDDAGEEMPVETAPQMVAWRAGGDPVELAPERHSPGHFVASPELEAGRWRFEFVAGLHGENVVGCFEETIREP